METTKVSSIPSARHKEKQKIHDSHSRYHQTTSYNGDYKSMGQHTRNDHSKSKNLEPDASRDLTDRDAPSDRGPSLVVDSPEHKPRGEEPLLPLPPPEISTASVMAIVKLRSAMSDLLEAIGMYEAFDEVCHDTPAWQYLVSPQVYAIKTNLRSVYSLGRYIQHLREGGEGTIEYGELERLAKGVCRIEKEGRLEWKESASKFREKYEQKKGEKHDNLGKEGEEEVEEQLAKLMEEHNKAYRHHIKATYGKKMKAKLGQLEAAAGEVDTLKGQLRTSWEELSRLTEKELDDVDEGY